MSEYDIDGDGYTDQAITVDYGGDGTVTVVDADGDGYADAVLYEPAETAYEGDDHPADQYGTTPTETDPGTTSSSYYNDLTGTGVSSDGDVGYISLGDGTFYDFGMG